MSFTREQPKQRGSVWLDPQPHPKRGHYDAIEDPYRPCEIVNYLEARINAIAGILLTSAAR